MKIWRGISLGLWSLVLMVLLLICATYFLISHTILNQAAITKQLDNARVYESLRTELIIPSITDQITQKSASNNLVNPDVIKQSLHASLSEADVKAISQPILDAVYGWIDKKRPDPSFSVSIEDETEQFIASLESSVKQKLASLPVCTAYYVDEAVLTRGECLPRYTTVNEALDEVMAQVREQAAAYETEITDQTIGLSSKQLGGNANIPDYLSYFWTLNLIAMPLVVLSMLFLLIKFRGTGAIVIGSVFALLGVGLLGLYLFIRSIPAPTETLVHNIGQAGREMILNELWPLVLIGVGCGLLFIGLGIAWRIHRRKFLHQRTEAIETVVPPEELLPDPVPSVEEKPKLEKRPLGRK